MTLVFCATFELLGTLSKNHPSSFSLQLAKHIRNSMIVHIQSLFKDDKANASLQLIGGAIQGLRDHLVNFTPTKDEDESFDIKLYECMIQLSDPDRNPNINTDHNRIAFRNMLAIIEAYAGLVSEKFFEDHKRWQLVLNKWMNSKSYEDKMSGVNAISTFHMEIAKTLVKRRDSSDEHVLRMFMEYFSTILHSSESEPHQIRIAIRGYGAMAEACKILLEPMYLTERFEIIMQRIDYCYDMSDKMKRKNILQQLPIFIESLSKIMTHLNEISGIQVQKLESVIVILIKDFHFLSSAHHSMVSSCLLQTFLNLEKSDDKNLDDVLDTVVWQGILWTCSHQLTYDMEGKLESISDWKEMVTYRNYLPLWKKLLLSKTKHDGEFSRINTSLYSYFIKHLFGIIDKLDLSTVKRKFTNDSASEEIEFFFTNPGLELQAKRSENYQLLYNLVQFYDELITQHSDEELTCYFIEWLELWIENSIKLSSRYPLVSGFVYLIEIVLKVIDRLNYSANMENDYEIKILDPLKYFIKSLFGRCQEISGELQVAILQLIFQSPVAVLKDYAIELIPVFIVGLTLGKSILTLAHHTLSCFEKLTDSLNKDPKTRRLLLKSIMPYMETFLSSKELSAENETKIVNHGSNQRKRIYIQSVETDLMRIKKKIFLFLGRRSPEEAQLILSNCDQTLVRNYIVEIFSVRLSCNDQYSPIIYLDQIFDRINKLALSSSDRTTRLSSCELLHGMVLYFMGKNLERDETLSLWKQICCNIITLGADEDTIITQLFEPLLFQMMHYYSNPSRILNPITTTLIDSLMTMISHKNNCVQDLSARLLREFIVWLFRQTSPHQRESFSPVRLVDLFQEMKKMSMETDQ